MKKIAIVGVHGTGKSKICEKVYDSFTKDFINEKQFTEFEGKFELIPEQFRKVVKDLKLCNSITLKQTENMTLETYARQLALECRYAEQGKNILCDRSVLDVFIYAKYFNNHNYYDKDGYNNHRFMPLYYPHMPTSAYVYLNSYSKIYLIEPSDRELEPDGFRLTDKKQQLQIHELFLKSFKDFDNVEIINQEEAHKEEFIEKVANKFIL
jgi:thymidylate kinase